MHIVHDTASAAIELRRAAELQPESLEYELYAVWAKARSYREIPIESDRQALHEPFLRRNDALLTLLEAGDVDPALVQLEDYLADAETHLLAAVASA